MALIKLKKPIPDAKPIPYVDPAEDKSLAPAGATVTVTGGKNSCFCDSGGPLVVAADNDRGYAQLGIVSWGPQCGNPLYPGVYTRVSSFSKWIKQNMVSN